MARLHDPTCHMLRTHHTPILRCYRCANTQSRIAASLKNFWNASFVKATLLKKKFNAGGELQCLLLRFIQALISQMARWRLVPGFIQSSSNYPKSGSWTEWSVRFLGCRTRRDDAEWCDRAGRSSAFRRKVRPRSGMRVPRNGRGIPCAARSPLRGAPRATLRGAPFQGVATQSCAAKIVQSTL